MKKHTYIFLVLIFFLIFPLNTQEANRTEILDKNDINSEIQDKTKNDEISEDKEDKIEKKEHITSYQIVEVKYEIKGITKETPLSKEIPIDKKTVFKTKDDFDKYIEKLNQQFKNLRIIEKHSITTEFLEVRDKITPVKLKIFVKDTWNMIALPYPKFDSNSGAEIKLKLKDNNFLGFMLPLNADITYKRDQAGVSSGSLGLSFSVPFSKKPVDFLWDISTGMAIKEKSKPVFNLGTGLKASYTYTYKILTFSTGIGQSFSIPDQRVAKNAKFDYYFSNNFYTNLAIRLYDTEKYGSLSWNPSFSIDTKWKFKNLEDSRKGFNIKWGHSLGIGSVNWHNNFRQGFSFFINNSYSYNTYKKGKVAISFSTVLTGFYSFIDRVGINTRFNFYYNLFNSNSSTLAQNLRGILNSRISTDTAFILNLDLPIKIGVLEFDKITGVNWTRYFGFELHIVPFFDMALTHNYKEKSYYHPKHGWYSGGFEFLVYPLKMRSIYGRISIGYDLSEIRSIKDFLKLKRTAQRDGSGATEIFIGIGLHY